MKKLMGGMMVIVALNGAVAAEVKPSILPGEEFNSGFEMGVRFGLAVYLNNPKEDNLAAVTRQAYQWWWTAQEATRRPVVVGTNAPSVTTTNARVMTVTNAPAAVTNAPAALSVDGPHLTPATEGESSRRDSVRSPRGEGETPALPVSGPHLTPALSPRGEGETPALPVSGPHLTPALSPRGEGEETPPAKGAAPEPGTKPPAGN